MKRMAKQCLVGLWVCTILAGVAQAQDEENGTARVSDQPGPLPPVAETVPNGPPSGYFNVTPFDAVFKPRAYFTSRAGVLYGYQDSFTNVGTFLPYLIEDNALLFVDASGLVTYAGKGGANLGVGWRYYMPEIQRIFGFSAWYDFDAGHIKSYNQIGLSLESLGRYFDMRLNGYIPIGHNQNIINTALTGQMAFSGNSLLVQRASAVESAFSGFDAEIGGPMPIFGRYGLSGYTGFYFYTAPKAGDFTGVSGRLTWQVNEDTTLGVQMTNDRDFGFNSQLQLSMYLPDGKQGRWLRQLDMRNRLMQRTIRDYRVTVEESTRITQEQGINPKNNQPYFIVHVDPNGVTGVASGDGTAQHPYNLISQFNDLAFPDKNKVSMVLVQPRADNSSTNLDTGVTLLSMQRLLSTSLPHTFQVAQQPGLAIPLLGVTQTGILPTLSNAGGGNVVTLADGAMMVEVSGFNINGSATGSGIVGTNNQAVSINHNVITNGLYGIQLLNLSGLAANGMQSTIDGNIIRGSVNDGIYIANAATAPLDLLITNNPPLNVDLNGDGLPDSLDGDSNFTNDGIANNGKDGVHINADAGSVITLAFENNRIFGNGANGLELNATANSTIQGTIFTNAIHDNGANGVSMHADNSTLDFLNLLTGFIDPTTGQPTQGQIRGNTIFGNGGDGIQVTGVGPSQFSLAVLGNTIGSTSDVPALGNKGIGFNFSTSGGNALVQVGAPNVAPNPPIPGVTNANDFSFNGLGGISIAGSGTALVAFDVENNRIRNSATGNTPAPHDEVTFSFDGISGTAPFIVTNLSDPGINITSIAWNLAGTPAQYDSNNIRLFGAGFIQTTGAIQPTNQTDITTGLTAVNGTPIIQGSVPLRVLATNAVVGTQVIPDGSQNMNLSFNNFNPQAAFSATTILSANVSFFNNDAPLPSSSAAGSHVTATFSNGLSTTFAVNLTSPTGIGISGTGEAFGAVTPGTGTGSGDGIHVAASGAAVMNQAIIQNNSVTGYGGFGVHVEANGLSSIPNLIVKNNTLTFNGTGVNASGVPTFTGGGLALERNDAASLTALVDSNTINQNFNDGFTVIVAGTALGNTVITSQNNTITNNVSDGVQITGSGSARLTFTSTAGDNVNFNNGNNWNVLLTDNVNATMNLSGFSSTGAGGQNGAQGDGFLASIRGTSVFTINLSTPTGGPQTSFSQNAGDGFAVNTVENGLALVNIDNVLFTTNNRDGLSFDREGASLILATIKNSQITNNLDDGIQFTARGSDVRDPNTPLFDPTRVNVINGAMGLAPASRLVLTNDQVNFNGIAGAQNGGNGIEIHTDDDANFVVDATKTSISNNRTDGVRAFSGGQSSFGNYWTGERSIFDNVDISHNQVGQGIKLLAMGQFDGTPTMLVQVSSNTGATNISDNAGNGIEASMPYGTIDLLVTGQAGNTWTTLFQRNGGDGIQFNVADVAKNGADAADVPGANVRVNGDPDGAQNEIVNFYFPNGWEFDHPQTQGLLSGVGILTVKNVLLGDENVNDAVNNGNKGNGIAIFNSNVENFTGVYFDGGLTPPGYGGNPGNQFDVNRDLVADNVGGVSGVPLNAANLLPVNLAGKVTLTIDNSSMSGNGIDGLQIQSDGLHDVFETGNLVNATVTNNLISSNGRHGVNIDLVGRHGETNVLNVLGFSFGGQTADYSVLTTNQFLFNNNVIERNHNYGFRYQANAGAVIRFDFSPRVNGYFWGEDFQDPQPTNPPGEFIITNVANGPLSAIFNSSGLFGPNNNFSAALFDDFYSIATDLNSNLVFTNNSVRFNGTPGQGFDFGPNGGGDGMFIRNSTDSYLSADIGGAAGSGKGNTFSGNALADVRFESFTATYTDGVTPLVPIAAVANGAPTPDHIYLDDTAQLTLRFNNNIGRELDSNYQLVGGVRTVGERGAAYADQGTVFIGFPQGAIRETQMFQVDDGANLDLNNTFNTGLTTEFNTAGGWHLVPGADPLFPNPTFPQNWTQDPGDPFFPP